MITDELDSHAQFHQDQSSQAVSGDFQTKKGNQWYFAMKFHFPMDNDSILIHLVVFTITNV